MNGRNVGIALGAVGRQLAAPALAQNEQFILNLVYFGAMPDGIPFETAWPTTTSW